MSGNHARLKAHGSGKLARSKARGCRPKFLRFGNLRKARLP